MTIETGGRASEADPALGEFTATIAPLEISTQDIFGNVLIVGHGHSFSERSLLSPEVKSLTLVDNMFPSDPQEYLTRRVIYRHPGHKPRLYPGAVNYYQWSLARALTGIKMPIFDAVTLFRAGKLQSRLPEILELVHRTLRAGKLFIGSGGFDELNAVPGMINGGFKIEKAVELPNPDHSGRHYPAAHIGFSLRKN